MNRIIEDLIDIRDNKYVEKEVFADGHVTIVDADKKKEKNAFSNGCNAALQFFCAYLKYQKAAFPTKAMLEDFEKKVQEVFPWTND